MFKFLRHELSSKKIDSIKENIIKAVENEDEGLWSHIKPLIQVQARQESAAKCLIEIVNEVDIPVEDRIKILTAISDSYSDNAIILGKIGESLESVRDIDMLNAAPPDEGLFFSVIDRLSAISEELQETDQEEQEC